MLSIAKYRRECGRWVLIATLDLNSLFGNINFSSSQLLLPFGVTHLYCFMWYKLNCLFDEYSWRSSFLLFCGDNLWVVSEVIKTIECNDESAGVQPCRGNKMQSNEIFGEVSQLLALIRKCSNAIEMHRFRAIKNSIRAVFLTTLSRVNVLASSWVIGRCVLETIRVGAAGNLLAINLNNAYWLKTISRAS